MKKPSSNNRTAELLVALLAACWAPQSVALSTDKDQPIEIEADSAEIDDLNNVSIYRGNVIVIQGSIHMTGDVMTVYNTEDDEIDTLIMEGNPATYRQLPDNSTVYDESRALRMEYYELKNLIVLIKEAWSKQGDAEISGDRIEYDTELSKVKAWRAAQQQTPAAGDKQPERVRIIIKKKTAEPDPAAPAPAE